MDFVVYVFCGENKTFSLRFLTVFISITFIVNSVEFRTFILKEGCANYCTDKGAAFKKLRRKGF